ncbi:LapA family protein [Rhodobacter sp. NTK016B]|uniref:lipopolysaccharide assembly protein LapA domain-containing protein n=1 Tax=Rhodobacter sp. NTK016B TaxID=2759676 RepID=UPI001A8D0FE2|nr:LapA family protein [Rhodobacter sp. NTK016B]MBN8290678.1 LapA family protein [Rhodobacter sp. NTK016B]
MKYLRYAFLAIVLLFCVTIALANREPVTLALWPDTVTAFLGFGYSITLPLFIIVGLAAGLGLVLGLIWEWLRERSVRVEAKQNRRELDRLRADQGTPATVTTGSAVATTKPGNGSRDQVLAILDDKDA